MTGDYDALRAANKLFGISVYGYEPGGPVTLEIMTPLRETFTFTAPTLAECVALAWPETKPPAPEAPVNIFD